MLLYFGLIFLFVLALFWVFRSILIQVTRSHEVTIVTNKDTVLHLLRELHRAQQNLLDAMEQERLQRMAIPEPRSSQDPETNGKQEG